MKTVIYTFEGNIPPKKNSRRLVTNPRTGKKISIPSESYKRWHSDQMNRLILSGISGQVKGRKFKIKILLQFPTFRIKDPTNTVESILDILVDARILPDDNWMVIPDLHILSEHAESSGAIVFIDAIN